MTRPVQVVILRRRPGYVPPPVPAKVPMTTGEIVSTIATIKDRVRRLQGVSHTNPHRFMEDKSELVRDLAVLEDAIRKGAPVPDRLRVKI